MGKLNEIAHKAYECAVRRGKIDPDNDSNNIFTAICLKKLPRYSSVRVRNLHILKSI